MTPATDARWLDTAARLGERARPASAPNPAVGAIIVSSGTVIGRGWTMPGGRPHAEAAALTQAGPGSEGATLYTTLEPCAHQSARGPSCADLIIEAGIARVVTGLIDPDTRTSGRGVARMEAAGIEVTLLENTAARRSLAGFLTRQKFARPHVTLKLAISLDGKIALPDGSSRWITSERARAHVHCQRARCDAILVGGGTWLADQPQLTVRLPGLEGRSPPRWVLSSHPVDGASRLAKPVDIAAMDGVQHLYVEGGAQTASVFLKLDLIDRIDLYRAPIIIGDGLPALHDVGLASLEAAHGKWALIQRRQLGSDVFEAYERMR